jgi:hypothetical protein
VRGRELKTKLVHRRATMKTLAILTLGIAVAGPVCAGQNPQQIALLRWYPTNNAAAFTGGKGVFGAAFDGQSIWISNMEDGTVTKLRASDGQTLGTFPAGSAPAVLAFDGQYLWVASDNLVVLQASDGSSLGTLPGPTLGLAFDGSRMWMSNGTSITGMFISNGKPATDGLTVTIDGGAGLMAFDGVSLWVANPQGGTVTRIRPSDGKRLGRLKLSGTPAGIVFDGSSLWVATQENCTVTKFSIADGSRLLAARLPYGCTPALGGPNLAFDGTTIWASHNTNNYGSFIRSFVTRIDARTGKVESTDGYYRDSTLGMLAFDGANVWVTLQPLPDQFGQIFAGNVLKR